MTAVAAEMAYEIGYQQALTLAAERVDELDAIWRACERPSYEKRVADRMAEFETYAAALHARCGTRPWAGLDNGAELPEAW